MSTEDAEVTPSHRLSYSAVSDFTSCGEKFRLLRVLKVPRVPWWAAIGGIAVHRVTEQLDFGDFTGVPARKWRDEVDVYRRLFLHEFEEEILNQEKVTGVPQENFRASGRVTRDWPDREGRDWWEANGPQQVASWRKFLADSPWQVRVMPQGDPAIEICVSWGIGEENVVGYIDRILENTATGDVAVVDLKSGSRKPTSSQQLGLYGHALSAIFKEEVVPKFGFYFMTRTGETSVPVSLDVYRDGRFEYMFASVGRAVSQGLFFPNVGLSCSACDVKDFCYAVNGRESGQVARPYWLRPYENERKGQDE